MSKKLRILVSNDDGINAPGLESLERIARKLSDDVWIVAPETEQSGTGHSLTLHAPLRIREVTPRRFAVSGTPTDAVLLGSKMILPRNKKVDLVLSGINRGSNLAEDITYSGTVAAAMEGALIGIPSIALSQTFTDGKPVPWHVAEDYAPQLIKDVLKAGWPDGTLVNINFPEVKKGKVKGVKLCHQGMRKIAEKLERRKDPRGRDYYWIGGERGESTRNQPGADFVLVRNGYITVTPITLDLTDYKTLEILREQVER